jgi:2-amino-4-hydroxy-6-hydroxymethyldihydropteridine diphosphokinase
MSNEGAAAVYLGLGSNLGNRAANLRMALRYLSPLARVEEVSSLYETAPVGEEEQPPFYNAVCRIVTGLEPEALLRHLKQIEFAIGRRPGPRWGPRPIDLDILLYGDRVLAQEGLVIPHPLLAERAFVLAPLAEIAPDLAHPVLRKSVRELLSALGDAAMVGVKRIEPVGWEVEQSPPLER